MGHGGIDEPRRGGAARHMLRSDIPMGTFSKPSTPLPAAVQEAINHLIAEARRAEFPIVDVETTASRLISAVPEAARLDATEIRTAIARSASKEPGMGVSFETDD